MINLAPITSGGLPLESMLLLPRPNEWQGETVEWRVHEPVMPVFLGSVSVDVEARLMLFGLRYKLSEAVLSENFRDDAHFIEFVVAINEERTGWTLHRLSQRTSVTYSDSNDTKDYQRIGAIRKPERLSISGAPKWMNKSDAVWPTTRGEPMTFVGQLQVLESDLAKRYFTWDLAIYLFQSGAGGTRTYKVLTQEIGEQSIDEHYANEGL